MRTETVDDGEAGAGHDVVEVGGASVVVESALEDAFDHVVDEFVAVDLVGDFDFIGGGRREVRVVPGVLGVVVDPHRAVVVRDGDPEFFDGVTWSSGTMMTELMKVQQRESTAALTWSSSA